jgi:hypothetical protein
VSKTFGEWYQKTNKTEDTNKLTLLAFTIHGWQRCRTAAIQERVTAVLPLLTVCRSFMNVANRVL